MKVTQSRLFHAASLHAKRFAKAWDYWIMASEGYSAGYRQAKTDAIATAHAHFADGIGLEVLGEEEVTEEVEDGLHQLSINTFSKWEAENKALSFPKALQEYMLHFDIKSVTAHEDKNGLISFQGTCKRKP